MKKTYNCVPDIKLALRKQHHEIENNNHMLRILRIFFFSLFLKIRNFFWRFKTNFIRMVFLFQSKPNYFWYIYISQVQIQSKAFFFPSPRASFIFHERKLKQCFDVEINLSVSGISSASFRFYFNFTLFIHYLTRPALSRYRNFKWICMILNL